MVKVIKYGKKRRVKCSTCGCLLEYGLDDVVRSDVRMNEYTEEIKCPNCLEKVTVRAS